MMKIMVAMDGDDGDGDGNDDGNGPLRPIMVQMKQVNFNLCYYLLMR